MSEETAPDNTTEKPPVEEKPRSETELLLEESAIRLNTSGSLDKYLVGDIDSLGEGRCSLTLRTNEKMMADKQKMVHSGFLASSAEYVALAAVNDENGMIFQVNSQYYACARVGDDVTFEAVVKHMDTRKKDVEVIAKIKSIKIYSATIIVVIPDYHPLKIKLMNVAGVKE